MLGSETCAGGLRAKLAPVGAARRSPSRSRCRRFHCCPACCRGAGRQVPTARSIASASTFTCSTSYPTARCQTHLKRVMCTYFPKTVQSAGRPTNQDHKSGPTHPCKAITSASHTALSFCPNVRRVEQPCCCTSYAILRHDKPVQTCD